MPVFDVTAPDGRQFEVTAPDGATQDEVLSYAKNQYAKMPPPEKPSTGIGAALESGVTSYVSPVQTGIESLTGSPEEAAKRGIERQKAADKKYEGPSLDAIKKIYQEQGILPAASKVISSIPEAIASQVPQIGAMGVGATIGGIGGGALGSVIGPEGTVAGATAGAKFGQMVGQAVSEFPQFYGSNIERQAQEQIAQGKPVDINRLKAAGAAGLQTASDIFEMQLLFGSSTIGKFLGFGPKELAEKTTAQVEKIAQEKLLTTIAKGTAKGAAAEIPNEIFQQMLERAQAGLSVTDTSALKEYGDTAYQVGLLSPLGILGQHGERGAARRELADRQIDVLPPETPPAAPTGGAPTGGAPMGGAPSGAPQIPNLTVQPAGLLPAPEVQTPTTTVPSTGADTAYANPEDKTAIEQARWEQARADSPAMQKLNQMEADRKAKQAAQQAKVDQLKAAQSAFTTATPENGLIRPPTQEQIDAEQAKADSYNNVRTIAITNKDGLNIYHGILNENGKVNVTDPVTGKKLTFNPNSPNVSIDPSEKELYALETKHTLGKASSEIDSQIKDAQKSISGNQDEFKTWIKNNPIDQTQAKDILPTATKASAKTGFTIKPDARTIFNKAGKPLDDILAKALEDGVITPEEYNNPADNSGENAFKTKLEALYGKQEVIPTPENEDTLAHIANLSNQKDNIENEIDKRNEFINAPETEPLTHAEVAEQAASPEATGIPENAEVAQALPLATEENTAPQQEVPAPAPETNIGPNGQVLFERKVNYSQDDKQRVRNLAEKLRSSLNKMGLKDVGLKIADSLNAHVEGKLESVNGAYLDKLIHLSLSGDDIFRTMNHEALHAMKDLGFFSNADWKILSDMAEKEWMSKYDIARDYGHETKEIQIEEAVAKAFADYQTQKPTVRAIMAKIVGAIKRFANAIRGLQNDRTAQTIFGEAAKGKLTANTFVKSPVKVAEKVQQQGKSINTSSPFFKNWIKDSVFKNADGSPQVLYHGTKADINTFRVGDGAFGRGIYLTPDPEKASTYAKHSFGKSWQPVGPEGGNVMPLYVSMKNPKINDTDVFKVKDENGKIMPISKAAKYITEQAKAEGHDGIVLKHPSTGKITEVIAFEPNQVKSAISNTGEFSTSNPDIRFEINPTTDRLTKISETKTAGKRIQETILNAYHDIQSNEFWTKARIAWVDPTTQLAKDLSSQPVFNMKGQLRADMLARTMTQIMNYVHSGIQMGTPMINSDGTLGIHETENNLARSQILADKLDSKRIRDINGRVMSGRDAVAEIARILRGKDIIREDKVRNAKGIAQLQKASELVQEYKKLQKESGGKLSFEKANKYVNQIKLLRKEGELNRNLNRELQVKDNHIQWAETTLNNNPEIKQILGIWKTVNNSLVNLWEKVGLFTKQQADQYRSNENYVPLFKSKEDLEDGINRYLGVASSATSKKEVKKLQGSMAVRNIWENMNSHYAAMVTSAYQNQTRKIAIEQLKALGAAEIASPKDANSEEVNMRYRDPTSPFADAKGWVNAIVYNPNTLAAFEMMHYEVTGILKFMGKATSLLRVTALVNPKYWIKQLIRDPIHATLVSNSGIITPLHALRDYIEVLSNDSAEAKILASRGVIGQIDPTTDIFDFIKKAGEERNDPNAVQKALHQINRMHELSDAATRVSIYKKAFADGKSRGMNNDQATNFAVHKARESINFSVHGNSKLLSNVRHMIPFVSAQITSLDSVYRAMFAKHLSGAEKAEAQRAFRNAAMIMTMTTLAYAMMYSGDDDYDKVPDVVKDNNWLIPNPLEKGSFIKIPIPFEIGYLFKILPEAGVRFMKGDSTGKEVIASVKTGFLNNVPAGGLSPWNFMPQAFRPILETISNYSNFTGRPIESMSDEGKPIAFRGDRASELSKHLSGLGLDKLGLSPAKIDYLIQAYTAELGTSANSIVSYAIAKAEGKPETAKNISEYPGLSGFMTNPNSSKAVADFYDLDHKASELYTEFNALKKTGQGQQAKEMLSDEQNKRLIESAPTLRRIQTEMTKLHSAINVTKADASLTPEQRRDRINKIEQQLDIVARQGYQVAKSVGLDRQ